ncbi:MAG: 3-phosphoshikimate 1-carboxyvinyltransferase [Muribaculaceae bacterium]|nr:3-phosphoshikimate 1-carboxyvinyltransferase [Muribaculaceae bacterium]MDE6754579.1 3-phosphoshikimate 1-carboxyvinyltransferase [Muribaculaceae bacterium]
MYTPPPVNLPYSKSIGARYLVASFFAGTLTACPEFNDCDDLRVIQKALLDLALNKEHPACGEPHLDIHASGTAFRFITAVCASTEGADFLVTGTPRVCGRPMRPLLDVLRAAGASIDAQGDNGTGPYKVEGRRLQGGSYEIRGDVSSQFISALMLVAPTWKGGMKLRFTTPLVSRPYAEMTAAVMKQFGIEVRLTDNGVEVPEGTYITPPNFKVEADWSAAGFFYEAIAIYTPRSIRLAGLRPPVESLQGDSSTADIFRKFGVISEFDDEGVTLETNRDLPDYIEVDMTDTPDLVPALVVACIGRGCRFLLTGVKNLRVKESDRLAALQTEMSKFGYTLKVDEDSIAWEGGSTGLKSRDIETYDDHRIAMAFAIYALHTGLIRIHHPEVVDKSFEDFWNQLPKIGLTCRRDGEYMEVSDRWEEL